MILVEALVVNHPPSHLVNVVIIALGHSTLLLRVGHGHLPLDIVKLQEWLECLGQGLAAVVSSKPFDLLLRFCF